MNLKNNYDFIMCYGCNKVNEIFWKLWCRECKPFIIIEKEKFKCEWCKIPEYHKHKFFKGVDYGRRKINSNDKRINSKR